MIQLSLEFYSSTVRHVSTSIESTKQYILLLITLHLRCYSAWFCYKVRSIDQILFNEIVNQSSEAAFELIL